MIFNPYHEWLGMDPDQTKPNYFDLLQVEIEDADRSDFPSTVRQQAREKLKRLDQVDLQTCPQSNSRQLAGLRNRVKRAAQVLIDPRRREEYLKSLPFRSPPPAIPANTGIPPQSLDLDSIPFAIPVKDGQSSDLPPKFSPDPGIDNPRLSRLSSKTGDRVGDPADFFQQLSLDHDSSANSTVRRSRKRHQRKISNSAAILILTTMAMAAAGGMWYLINRFAQPQPEPLVGVKENDPAAPASAAEPASEALRENQSESLLADAANARLNDLEESLDENWPANSPPPHSPPPNRDPPAGNPPSRSGIPNRVEERIDISQLPDDGMAEYGEFLAELSDIERYRFQFLLAKLRLDAFRNDLNEMQRSRELLDQWIGKFADPNSVPRSPLLRVRLEETRQAMDSLSEFWKQLRLGVNQMPALNTIDIGEKVYAMVEKSDAEVVLRHEGRNLRYPLEFLPAQLAIRLAESGPVENIPAWQLHQAQFLIYQLRDRPLWEPEIRKLIANSEADGYKADWLWNLLTDVGALAGGSKFARDWDQAEPAAAASVQQFREQQEYPEPSRLTGTQALEKLQVLATIERPDLSQVVGLAQEMSRLAAAAGDADWLHQGVMELAILQHPSAYPSLLEGLKRIAQQELNITQTRKLYRLAQLILFRQERLWIVAGVELPRSPDDDLSERAMEEFKQQVTARLRQHNLQGMGVIEGSLR